MAATKQEVLDRIARLRTQLDALLAQVADDPAMVNTIPDGIKPWTQGVYVAGDIRMYNGIPRKCVQAHTSIGSPDWTPDITSLWMQYHGTSAETARAFVAPTGGHDVYRTGEYMLWEGAVYRVADGQDNVAYSPAQWAAGWAAVT